MRVIQPLAVGLKKENRSNHAVEAVLCHKYLSVGLLIAEKSNYKG
jgi:hypothetical protein